MALSIAQWHQRYLQQAQWSASVRRFCYRHARLRASSRILDVGCGTGVLTKELRDQAITSIYGLDIDPDTLAYAKEYSPSTNFTTGDARCIPFSSGIFDITLCHFVLLWIKDVDRTVCEMRRVTRSNGFVLALAEPDYGGRIDFPAELAQVGAWQQAALRQRGANPCMGRELRAAFHAAGLKEIEVGVMGGQWTDDKSNNQDPLEWQVIQADLAENPDFIYQADHLKQIDQLSREASQRILFVPTFYAIGMVAE